MSDIIKTTLIAVTKLIMGTNSLNYGSCLNCDQ
jgi:hypothetical protein